MFGIRSRGKNSDLYEVSITNLYGHVRLEDFWSPGRGATQAECKEYIARIKAASAEITRDIMKKRPTAMV